MPFISKDWRSPGEAWVKTEEGWEKKKILECGKRFSSSFDSYMDMRSDEEDKENIPTTDNSITTITTITDRKDEVDSAGLLIQPHCHITLKCTREIAGFNGLSDAFKRLDFRNAVRDIRRFNYICKLLDLLITQNLTTLSGCAQKVLFTMLEEVACQVYVSQQNIHTLNKLLNDLRKTLIEYYCWGRPLGSTVLWTHHRQTIDRINNIAGRIEINEPDDKVYPKLENLPEECVREILLRLADHKDLHNSGQAYALMKRLVDEQRIWRELCSFHFTHQQMTYILTNNKELEDKGDWQQVYHKLRKQFGLREEYAEILQLCRNCRCLFWKSIGHPCIADQDPEYQEKLDRENVDRNTLYVPVPPQAFLKFFSL